jgi:hypothetical protein
MSKTSRESFDLMHGLVKKIGCQFPDTAEGRLMLAVINVALSDLITNRRGTEIERYRENAARYLSGDMWHALVAGVDPEWIRLQLKIAGFDIEGLGNGMAPVEHVSVRDGRGLSNHAIAN